MELEQALKVAALLVSAIGAWKVLSEITRARRTSVRDDYRFAKEFLTDLRAKEPMHTYLRDKGYEALVSGSPLSTREIEYLLSLPEPVRSLREYASGRKYLQHASTAGTKQLLIKKQYRKSWVLNALLWVYLLLFLGAYTAAWSPLLFATISQQLGLGTVSALAVTLLAFWPRRIFLLPAELQCG